MGEFPSLANQLLIAMPTLGDPNFHRTVTLICEHTADGALGIVINRPIEVSLGEIFEQLDLRRPTDDISERFVLNGGPVQQERGFVVHRPGGTWESTLAVSADICVTTSRDILAAMARGDCAADSLVALGYAGWRAGQLEQEIQANAWLSVPADVGIIFEVPYPDRWQQAGRLLGIEVDRLSGEAGHA